MALWKQAPKVSDVGKVPGGLDGIFLSFNKIFSEWEFDIKIIQSTLKENI